MRFYFFEILELSRKILLEYFGGGDGAAVV